MRDRTAATEPQYTAEHKRVQQRREQLGLPTEGKRWALALSGGGIRSATFSLGVLQAMARAPVPPARAGGPESSPVDVPAGNLLAHFDYLSTVSGGGYIGAFFTSLFIPDRLRQREQGKGDDSLHPSQTPKAAAEQAYEVLKYEPPERIHSSADYARGPVGRGPLGWLRENGRYLAPAGAGDVFYVLATTLRNLLSVHFVIGMPLLSLLALVSLLKLGLADHFWPGAVAALAAGPLETTLWWLPLLWLLVGTLPLLIAYWLGVARTSQGDPAKLVNVSSVTMAVVASVVTLVPLCVRWFSVALPRSFLVVLSVAALVLWLALVAFIWVASTLPRRAGNDGADNSVRNYRIQVTRRLSGHIIVLLGLMLLAALDSLTGELYQALAAAKLSQLSMVSLGPLLIALVRLVVKFSDGNTLPRWISKLPLSVIAGVAGVATLLFVALLWDLLVYWVQASALVYGAATAVYCLAALALGAFALAVCTGQFMGFINLSSLQSFYASRLARTYLGASNGLRFRYAGRRGNPMLSVVDAIKDDDIQLAQLYSATCAPLHLINVTLNITVDPSEQLVQRDRKGKPLCVAPGIPGAADASGASFILDGVYRPRLPPKPSLCELNQPMSVSYWIGTSGAALTTGLGRATSLGTSLALGLANVRLGTWWPSAFAEWAAGGGTIGPGDAPMHKSLSLSFSRSFKTQTYLLYEMTAHFHGLRREYQYLSDGGHFENTAVYELLRPRREIELIVACDNGCDPACRFDDLANLVRLARIDQGVELEVDTRVRDHAILAPYFAHPEDFAEPVQGPDRRCAVLLNAWHVDSNERRHLQARVLLLKPRLISGLPVDVTNYAALTPSFPNESTANQFFDEAQFESYRQLGLHIGQALFGSRGDAQHSVAKALWEYLEAPL
ncbi:patatin-like phospholipase family protein [Pseudomonas sp. RIT-PI-S]|uniref:patatin-like phospholipase family protein n=1 Tax=Pseudomonas sp. RIT-PI-S TaxID=3035295 RepID=UPI0021D8DFD4|nr:patatin-like phospholipase family protein [Pseudomonas sp. RIT-PI-S]